MSEMSDQRLHKQRVRKVLGDYIDFVEEEFLSGVSVLVNTHYDDHDNDRKHNARVDRAMDRLGKMTVVLGELRFQLDRLMRQP